MRQTPMPVVCLHLSWVLCHTPCSCPGFPPGCASEEGHLHQLLTAKRQDRHEEHLFGGRLEHCQPQTSGLQEQFCQLAILLLQPCATSAVSTELQCPFLSPPSHTALHAALFRGRYPHRSSQELLPCGGFPFPPCPAPFHRCTGFVPTTTDRMLISQTPAGREVLSSKPASPPKTERCYFDSPNTTDTNSSHCPFLHSKRMLT